MAAKNGVVLEIVASDGDLILQVGDPMNYFQNECKILVSSRVLEQFSKVFAALMGPHFSEGQVIRSSESPQTISLPEDTPEPMLDLCLLVHGKIPKHRFNYINPENRDSPNHRTMYFLSLAVDKYALVDHLRLQCQALLLECLDKYPPGSPMNTGFRGDGSIERILVDLVASAYFMDNQRCFEIATSRLIQETCDGFYPYRHSTWPYLVPSELPKGLIQAIEHRRLLASDEITHQLPHLLERRCGNYGCWCLGDGAIPWQAIQAAFQVEYWPGKRNTVHHAIQCMRTLPGSPQVICMETGEAKAIDHKSVEDFIGTIQSMCSGICLRCVRKGNDLLLDCDEEDHKGG